MTEQQAPKLPHDASGFLTGGERLINGIDEVKLDTHAILAILKNLNNRQQQAQQSVRDSLKHIGQQTKKTVEAVNQSTATLAQKLGTIRPTIDSENLGQGQVNPVVVNPNRSNSSNEQGPSVNADSGSNPPVVNAEQGTQNPLPSPSPSPSPSPRPVPNNRQRDDSGRFSSGEDNKQGWWNKLKAMVRGGVQEANTDTRNIDPTVDAVRELGDALSPVVKVGKAMFKGAAWLFGRKKKQPPPSDQEQRQQTRIEKLLRRIADARARATGAAGQGLNLLGGIGGSLLGGLGSLLMRALIPALGLTAAFNFGQWIGGKIYEFIEPALTPLIDGIAAIPETISNAWQSVVDIASKGIEAVVDSFKSVKDKVTGAYESTVQAATNGIENVANGAKGIWNWGRGVYNKAVDKTSDAITKVNEVFTGDNKTSASSIVSTGRGYNEMQLADGSIVRRTGARNWRNNNSGNIEYGDFAKKHGAIGSDGRFAIFPTYEAGRAAKSDLIFNGKNYKDLDLMGAINRYAPPSENDTAKYQRTVLAAVGGANKRMADYTPDERNRIMDAMEKMEGFKAGKTEIVKAANVPSSQKVATITPQSTPTVDKFIAAPLKMATTPTATPQVAMPKPVPTMATKSIPEVPKVDAEKSNGIVPPPKTVMANKVPSTVPTTTPQSTPMVDKFIAAPLKMATTPTATPQVAMPKPVPTMTAKTVPEVPKVQQQVSTVKPKTSGSNAGQEGISQNISDRLLAHAVTGGLGMDRAI